MGLTVSRKTAKNLAVRRKNERILFISRKKYGLEIFCWVWCVMRLCIRVLVACVAGRWRGGKRPKLEARKFWEGRRSPTASNPPASNPPASNPPALHALAFPISLPFGRLPRRLCSGSENCNRKCRKCLYNLSHGCRCASWQTFWQLYYFTTFYTFFHVDWLRWLTWLYWKRL